MLRIDNVQTLRGVTVYGDDANDYTFYVMPETPRFRTGPDGKPVFMFLKYRTPIEHQDKSKGGGFVFFDMELSVDPATQAQIVGDLQNQVNGRHTGGNPPQVIVGTITYDKGAASLLLQAFEGGDLIEKVANPASPSLFGKNITPFAVELTPEGATLFEQALQGQGGVVQVAYDLTAWVKLPPITGYGWFYATEFYSFMQSIHINYDIWGETSYQETLREQFSSSQSEGTSLTFGTGVDPKLQDEIRSNLQKSWEEGIKQRMLSAIKPVGDSDRGDRGDDDVNRNIETTKIESFTVTFSENDAVEWEFRPGGTLPNITTLKGPDGNPLKWSDYSRVVDLDDPFFKTLNVSIQVNADFKALPINSIDVHLDYNQGQTHTINDYHFTSTDQVEKFASYIENNVWSYTYSFIVNYADESQTYQAPAKQTTNEVLTIDVGDVGILSVNVVSGNLDFTKVTLAEVTVHYDDASLGAIEETFTLDVSHRDALFQHVLFHPPSGPYKYKLLYTMADGTTYAHDWVEASDAQLVVNSPFNATRVIGLRAAGDLNNDIDQIFVDLTYTDEANHYTQTTTVALNRNNQFFNWAIPVLDPAVGTVTYSCEIRHMDGTVESVPVTTATSNTILVGDLVSKFLKVEVLRNLVDFNSVSLVKVNLHYSDPANAIDQSGDLVAQRDGPPPDDWVVKLKDPTKLGFDWSATYFMADGSTHQIADQQTNDPLIVLPRVAPS